MYDTSEEYMCTYNWISSAGQLLIHTMVQFLFASMWRKLRKAQWTFNKETKGIILHERKVLIGHTHILGYCVSGRKKTYCFQYTEFFIYGSIHLELFWDILCCYCFLLSQNNRLDLFPFGLWFYISSYSVTLSSYLEYILTT